MFFPDSRLREYDSQAHDLLIGAQKLSQLKELSFDTFDCHAKNDIIACDQKSRRLEQC
jgi:hypothetical protein